MLTGIELENYKCFSDRVQFNVSNINLFTGINGRGKSSVLQSLLLMSQSARNTNSLKELLVSSSLVKLGDFDDIKGNDEKSKGIKLGFLSDIESLKSFEFEYKEKNDNSGKGILYNYVLNGNDVSKDNLTEDAGEISQKNDSKVKLEIAYQDDLRILKVFKDIHYVGADRMGPVLYVDKYDVPSDIQTGIRGEYAVKILSMNNTPINPSLILEVKPKNMVQLCQQWMNYIFDGARIEVKGNKDDSVLSLMLNPKNEKRKYKAVNVGFGYSYILSLIVTSLIAKKGDIVIFENPEAHLHPRAQTRLVDLFVRLSLCGVQIFIESHSEHILNGLRMAIAKNIISNTNLSIYYFDENFKNRQLVVRSDGFIDNWPEGFFDESDLMVSQLYKLSK